MNGFTRSVLGALTAAAGCIRAVDRMLWREPEMKPEPLAPRLGQQDPWCSHPSRHAFRASQRYPNARHSPLHILASTALLASCAAGTQATLPRTQGTSFRRALLPPVQHVVIIVQENRSVDNLFQFLPGANTQSWGYDEKGKAFTLRADDLDASNDPVHSHPAFIQDFDGRNNDGWEPRHMAYVPQSDVQPYYALAETYAFGDDMFQTNEGPSFPAHQYLVSGTSSIRDGSKLLASENPVPGGANSGGCNSSHNQTVAVIDQRGNENQSVFPCFERNSLMTEADAAGVSWAYYQASGGAGIWHAPDAIKPIWQNNRAFRASVKKPSSHVLTDIFNGDLADIVWVTPSKAESDHGGWTDGTGPDWVASIVNAIGYSQYWSTTTIIVVWDDWGGWYDHVAPVQRNSYELGYRVPLLVISPYVNPGYISHVQHEFGSILKYTEETFNLPSMGTTDANADDLSDFFNPVARRFKPIHTNHDARYFLAHNVPGPPDDD